MAFHLCLIEPLRRTELRGAFDRRRRTGIRSMFRQWFYGQPAKLSASREEAPPANAFHAAVHQSDDHVFQRRWLNYMLKGVDCEDGRLVGQEWWSADQLLAIVRPSAQGEINFKRVGTSRSHGVKRRGGTISVQDVLDSRLRSSGGQIAFASWLWRDNEANAFLLPSAYKPLHAARAKPSGSAFTQRNVHPHLLKT